MPIDLSLIIPALNEAGRLPPYLDAIRGYLPAAGLDGYEVIVVDDGSRDGTDGVVARRSQDWPELALLRHPVNRGKGAAVRSGVLAARGQFILFADADGATPIAEERRLRAAIEHGADLAVGSRLLAQDGVQRRRRWHRRLSGLVFLSLARVLLPVPIRDTQCGFKMFRRDVGRRLFGSCHEDGYLFDLHVLAVAERLGYRIAEVPICWNEMAGSKVHLVRDSWRMARGLLHLRRSVATATAMAERGAAAAATAVPISPGGIGEDSPTPR